MTSLPANHGPRLAARALIVEQGKLLIVNAYPGGVSDLWCAPGGGVERHVGLADNLMREVREETGLTIAVEGLAGINEFHDPASGFHQVDLFFRARRLTGSIDEPWTDPEGIVTERQWVTGTELVSLRHKPDSLRAMAFGDSQAPYDPLERLVR